MEILNAKQTKIGAFDKMKAPVCFAAEL